MFGVGRTAYCLKGTFGFKRKFYKQNKQGFVYLVFFLSPLNIKILHYIQIEFW